MIDISKRSVMWILVGFAAAIMAVLFWCAGLHVRFSSSAQLFLWISAGVMCLVYRPADGTWQQKLLDSMEFAALLSLISTLGAFGTYAMAALTTGYADDLLAAADRVIGFDWVFFYNLSRDHYWLQIVGKCAYVSIFLSPTILVLAFAWTGRRLEARRFLFAFGVALAITVIIATFFFGRGAIAHYVGMTPPYMPQVGVHHIKIIDDLRAGLLDHVDPARLAGLLSFPSFHATSAVLFIWGAWPIRWLRGPMLGINLAMLAFTPVEGGHYLVEVIAGVAIAWLGVAALRFTAPRIARPAAAPAGTPMPAEAPMPVTASVALQ